MIFVARSDYVFAPSLAEKNMSARLLSCSQRLLRDVVLTSFCPPYQQLLLPRGGGGGGAVVIEGGGGG